MTKPLDLDTPQGHRVVRTALEAFIADLDYDIHKGILCGEDDGLNRYDETTGEFIALLRRRLTDEGAPPQPDAPLDLAAIQARCDAATPGPWHVEDDKRDLNRWVADKSGYLEINFGYLNNGTQPDARFVAHARTDVEQLVARVRELEAEAGRWERRARRAEAVVRHALWMYPLTYNNETAAEMTTRFRSHVEANFPDLVTRYIHQPVEVYKYAEECGCVDDGAEDDGSNVYDNNHCEEGEDGPICSRSFLGRICSHCTDEDGDGPEWSPDGVQWPCPPIAALDGRPVT